MPSILHKQFNIRPKLSKSLFLQDLWNSKLIYKLYYVKLCLLYYIIINYIILYYIILYYYIKQLVMNLTTYIFLEKKCKDYQSNERIFFLGEKVECEIRRSNLNDLYHAQNTAILFWVLYRNHCGQGSHVSFSLP